MIELQRKPYRTLASITVVLGALAGCTARISPLAASLEDRQEKVTLRLQVSSTDLAKLMKPGFVVYLGLGDCREESGRIFSQANLDGTPLVSTSLTVPKDGGIATLTADFDDHKVLNYGCAFVKAASMGGNGAASGPVKVSLVRKENQ